MGMFAAIRDRIFGKEATGDRVGYSVDIEVVMEGDKIVEVRSEVLLGNYVLLTQGLQRDGKRHVCLEDLDIPGYSCLIAPGEVRTYEVYPQGSEYIHTLDIKRQDCPQLRSALRYVRNDQAQFIVVSPTLGPGELPHVQVFNKRVRDVFAAVNMNVCGTPINLRVIKGDKVRIVRSEDSKRRILEGVRRYLILPSAHIR